MAAANNIRPQTNMMNQMPNVQPQVRQAIP
jgi:hypothetical protein